MKVTKATKVASKGASTAQSMSGAEQDQLHDLTINEAIERGLVTDLADEEGNFIMASGRDDVDAHYAVINGKAVRCSNGIADALDTVPEQVGDLRFQKGISNVPGDGFGKPYFRLTLPRGINLTKVGAVKLQLEPVEA